MAGIYVYFQQARARRHTGEKAEKRRERMAKQTKRLRKSLDEMTPFARIILGFMQAQWPPLSVPEFAELAGVSVQAVYGWFSLDALPRRQTLDIIAERTGIDRERLYEAAGYDLASEESDALAQRLAELPPDVRERALWMLNLPDEELQRALARMHAFVERARQARSGDAMAERPKATAGVL